MAEGLLQVPRGMEHVGRDQQIIAMGFESLVDRVLLDIQRAVVDGPAAVAEPRFRLGKETRGNIRIGVFEPTRGELRQHVRSRGSRAGSDFDHPETPAIRQCGHQRLYRLGQHLVRRPRNGRFQVKIARRRFSAAEQEGKGVFPSAKHLHQGEAGPPEQPDLDLSLGILALHPVGERLEVGRHMFRERVLRTHDYEEPVIPFFHHARSGEHLEEPAEEARVLGQDA